MTRVTVGILRGGTSNEYNLSLKTGAAMHTALPQDKYDTRDILVDKRGYWHLRGMPVTPSRALAQVDVVLNAIHGGVGEDGSVHRILDRIGIPYAGSRALPSGFSLNKIRARTMLKRAGVAIPRGISFTLENEMSTGEMADAVFAVFGPPYMVKPPSDGASYGIRVAANIVELADVIGDVLDANGGALVEEFLRGEEVHTGVIEKFRGQELYVLPAAHLRRPAGSRHVESVHHEEGSMEHTVPSNFTHEEKQAIADLAKAAHQALSMSHYSRIDIMVTPRGPFVLEVDSVPGLYQGSAFPKSLEAVGSSTREFLEHVIHLARN